MIHTSSLAHVVHVSEGNAQLCAWRHNYCAESLFEVVYFGECVVVTHMQTQTSGSRRRMLMFTKLKGLAGLETEAFCLSRIQLQFRGCRGKLLTTMQKMTNIDANQLSLRSVVKKKQALKHVNCYTAHVKYGFYLICSIHSISVGIYYQLRWLCPLASPCRHQHALQTFSVPKHLVCSLS